MPVKAANGVDVHDEGQATELVEGMREIGVFPASAGGDAAVAENVDGKAGVGVVLFDEGSVLGGDLVDGVLGSRLEEDVAGGQRHGLHVVGQRRQLAHGSFFGPGVGVLARNKTSRDPSRDP